MGKVLPLSGGGSSRTPRHPAPAPCHPDDSGIDDAVWSPQHVQLLQIAAELPHVDRIFVNKFIKERLCQTVGGNRAWLNDLVFVFAVTQLSHSLLAHLTLLGAIETGLLMMAMWWVWIYTSWITNWLDP